MHGRAPVDIVHVSKSTNLHPLRPLTLPSTIIFAADASTAVASIYPAQLMQVDSPGKGRRPEDITNKFVGICCSQSGSFCCPCEIVAQIKSIYCNHPWMVRRRRQQRAYPAIKGVKLARDLIAQDIEMHVKGHPPASNTAAACTCT